MAIFDELPPDDLATLYDLLSRWEPKILGIIRSGSDLSPAERERVDDAIMDESVAVMTPDFKITPEHDRMHDLVRATRALVPLRSSEIKRPYWRKGMPIPQDHYGDGGAANGYGRRPHDVPPEEWPPPDRTH